MSHQQITKAVHPIGEVEASITVWQVVACVVWLSGYVRVAALAGLCNSMSAGFTINVVVPLCVAGAV